jgi:hypothetical protein
MKTNGIFFLVVDQFDDKMKKEKREGGGAPVRQYKKE